jgi:hypothetical protein
MSLSTGTALPPEPAPAAQASYLFLIQIHGPPSEEEFARTYFQDVQAGLAESDITAMPLGDGLLYFIYGFHHADPADAVRHANWPSTWWQGTTQLLSSIKFGLPQSGPAILCDMPHNGHAFNRGETQKTCQRGHRISVIHQVPNCPVCGKTLS